jgi:hypothetical protein
VSQFEEEAPETEAAEETVPDTKFSNTSTNKDAVARRRRIEEVIEGKRTKKYGGDYDFNFDD